MKSHASYPRSYSEFCSWFRSEEDCRKYLAQLRWPQSFTCPTCGWTGNAWETGRGLHVCGACSRQTSVTSGTIFAGTKTPLRAWLQCAWVLATSDAGSSAVKLQGLSGVPNYRTLWAMLQRYRRAMFQPSRCRLKGRVELSFMHIEALHGSPGKGGGGKVKDNLVLYLSEVDNTSALGRVRMAAVPNDDLRSVPQLVRGFVQLSAVVAAGPTAGPADRPSLWMPSVLAGRANHPGNSARTLAQDIDSWLRATHGGAVHVDHLNYYLGEYLYRHNRRRTPDKGLNFSRLLRHALGTGPVPYKHLVMHPSL